jgi:hypothetical protein
LDLATTLQELLSVRISVAISRMGGWPHPSAEGHTALGKLVLRTQEARWCIYQRGSEG